MLSIVLIKHEISNKFLAVCILGGSFIMGMMNEQGAGNTEAIERLEHAELLIKVASDIEDMASLIGRALAQKQEIMGKQKQEIMGKIEQITGHLQEIKVDSGRLKPEYKQELQDLITNFKRSIEYDSFREIIKRLYESADESDQNLYSSLLSLLS